MGEVSYHPEAEKEVGNGTWLALVSRPYVKAWDVTGSNCALRDLGFVGRCFVFWFVGDGPDKADFGMSSLL
jgi:hypothetical protein